MTMTTPEATTLTTFDSFQDKFCRKNHTIYSTLLRITSEIPEGQEVPFTFPKRKTWLTSPKQVAMFLENGIVGEEDNESDQNSTWSSYFSGLLRHGNRQSYTTNDDDENDDDELSDDDYKTRIYNKTAIRGCVHILKEYASTNTVVDGSSDTHGIDAAIIPRAEWETWVSRMQHASTKNEWSDFVASLSSNEKEFLLQVLVEMNHAKIVDRSGSITTTSTTGGDNDDNFIIFRGSGRLKGKSLENDMKNCVYLWDVDRTIQRLEHAVKECEKKRDDYLRKAVLFKKSGNIKRALYILKLKKLYDAQIDTKIQQEVNIRQARLQVENMQMNKENLNVMKDSTEMLRNVRESLEITPENVEEIHDQFMSELDLQQELDAALKAFGSTVPTSSAAEDDALLDELKNLMDTEEGAPSNNDDGPVGHSTKDDTEEQADISNLKQKLDGLKLPPKGDYPTKGDAAHESKIQDLESRLNALTVPSSSSTKENEQRMATVEKPNPL